MAAFCNCRCNSQYVSTDLKSVGTDALAHTTLQKQLGRTTGELIRTIVTQPARAATLTAMSAVVRFE